MQHTNWGKRLIFKKRNSFRDRSCQLWRTIHTGQANILYKLRKYNATTQTQCVGDCSFWGIAKKAVNVYKKSNVENPLKTGNAALDYAAGQIKPVKAWNTGFNAGKYGFIAKQTYDETCKRKKQNQSEYRRTDMNKTLANLLILGGVNHIISYIPLPQLINQIWSVYHLFRYHLIEKKFFLIRSYAK